MEKSSIFRPVVRDPGVAGEAVVRALEDYQQELLGELGARLKDAPGMALEQDFAREYYLAVGRLRDCKLDILPATYFRLLGKLLGAAAVPFRGEPLKGLQVMGPLETRALDFEKLIVLSCNEGMFPRRSVASSFVPAELRKGFGLPTYEYQDAVWVACPRSPISWAAELVFHLGPSRLHEALNLSILPPRLW